MEKSQADGSKTTASAARRFDIRPEWGLIAVLYLLVVTTIAWLQSPHPSPLLPIGQRSVLDWWLYPHEINPAARLSSAPGALNAVHTSPDGQRGWAVGAGGTVLHTEDGGQQWVAQTSGVQAYLWSITFDADGQRGWAVGDGGTVLHTEDGGQRWVTQTSGVRADLTSVTFAADSQRGWAVGTGGTVLHTEDGGQQWQAISADSLVTFYAIATDRSSPLLVVAGAAGTILLSRDYGAHWEHQRTKVGSSRLGLWLSHDGQQIWAVGYPPALLHSKDGGNQWVPANLPLRHSRYPAPWYGIALLGFAWLAWNTFSRTSPERKSGADALAASDAPANDFNQDRLQFGPLARGLSRFLRNPATEPPLAVAISGDWGSGKSSLMNLVCRDLERYGHKPVWFNAWHHQGDEQLLAAMLSAIRDKALPHWFSLDGLTFRTKLLYSRSVKHYGAALTVALLISASTAFMVTHKATDWGRFADGLISAIPESLRSSSDATTQSASATGAGKAASEQGKLPAEEKKDKELAWLKLLGASTSVITALTALQRALRAFGADPAILLSGTAENFRLKDAHAVTNFRARFAEQFDEVCDALPYRMVVVIDDLDRCKPEAVLNVMEGVNFLMSSGKCFVIFGMATHRVQAALALSFDRIAKELVELDLSEPDEKAGRSDAESAECEKRRRYARDYLEKLINLEVRVPSREDIPPHELLHAPETQQTNRLRASFKRLCKLLPLAGVSVAIYAGSMAGWKIDAWWSPPPPPPVVIQPEPAKTELVTDKLKAVVEEPSPKKVNQSKILYAPTVQPGVDGGMSWRWIVLPALAVLIGCAAYGLWQLRKGTREVSDSHAFRAALEAWAPLVQRQRGTPRAVKRFGNRVRYLAMLQQGEQLDESGWDLLWRRLSKWCKGLARQPHDDVKPVPTNQVLEEHRIVALGALHEVFGDGWRDVVSRGLDATSVTPDLAMRLREAIIKYRNQTDSDWPPSIEEQRAFDRALSGVRLPGSPGVLSTQVVPEKAMTADRGSF